MSVFANGREVSGKAQPNEVIAGFPSVCMSPPPPPAGPIPIPYPMFTNASKTSQGTVTVKVKNKEVGKKNSSTYKDSKGNEPATRSFGMDVVTHTLSGASKHVAYSFDVKAQGAGVERFMDLTTTNHSNPATAFTINTASLNVVIELDHDNPCADLQKLNKMTRENWQKTDNADYVQKTGNGNTTITSALYIPLGAGDGGGQFQQASSRKIMSQHDETLSKGFTEEQYKTVQDNAKDGIKTYDSDICNGFTYEKTSYMPPHAHTEARILEDLFRGVPKNSGKQQGKIILGIHWPTPKKGKTPQSPCDDCERLLCAVAPCIQIVVCNEVNEPINYNEKCSKKKSFPE